MGQIEINREVCNGCGICVQVCPVEVYDLQDSQPVIVHLERCTGCGVCEEQCSVHAIRIEE